MDHVAKLWHRYAWMGRWHPVGAMVATLFFGFTAQLQSQLQIIQTPIPADLPLSRRIRRRS